MTKAERKNRRNMELCQKIRENDLLAETRLLMENEGLITQLACAMKEKRRVNSSDGFDENDLIQEGRLAMLTAAKAFDEGKGVKFSTFAYGIMQNAMTDLCDKCQSSFERHLEAKGLTRLFLDDEEVSEKALYGKGGNVNHMDPTGSLAVLHVMIEKMRNRLELLPERQRRILAYHYGLGALTAKAISETAAFFHLSEKYMKVIEQQALDSMRTMMNDGKIV